MQEAMRTFSLEESGKAFQEDEFTKMTGKEREVDRIL